MISRSSLDLDLAHARETGDAAAEARCLMQFAEIAIDEESDDESSLRTVSQAFYAQAAQIFERLGDDDGRAEALTALAHLLGAIDDPMMERMAHLLYEDVVSLYAHSNDLHALALILTAIPPVTWRLDEQTRADVYTRALAFMDQFTDPIEKADLLVLLAETMVGWPGYKEAVPTFEKALSIFQEARNHLRQAAVLRRLGRVIDDDKLALAYCLEAAELYEALGEFAAAGSMWQEIAKSAKDNANLGITPQSAYERALTLFQQADDVFYQGLVLYELGLLRLHTNEVEAKHHFEQASQMFAQCQDIFHLIKALQNLAFVNKSLGDMDSSRRCFEQALALTADQQERAHLLREWGRAEHYAGNRDEAFQRFQQAIEEHRQIDQAFTPSMIAEWTAELIEMGYLPANSGEDDHDD